MNYGPLSNDILLLDYGFVLPNNPNDRVELRYDGQLLDTACLVAKMDSVCSFKHPARWQQELLERLKLHGPGASQSVVPLSLRSIAPLSSGYFLRASGVLEVFSKSGRRIFFLSFLLAVLSLLYACSNGVSMLARLHWAALSLWKAGCWRQ